MIPLRKGMRGDDARVDDALRVIRRYNVWRRGGTEKTFEEWGLDVTVIGESLDVLCRAVTSYRSECKSLRARLQKTIVSRAEIHGRLRALSAARKDSTAA